MAHKTKNVQVLTIAQQLGSLIKSACDIMRMDKGLNGELDSGTVRAIFQQASRFIPEDQLRPHFYMD